MRTNVWMFLSVIISALLLTPTSHAVAVDLKVLKEPSPAVIDGKNHFIYELVITNNGPVDLQLKEIEVDGQALGSLHFKEPDLKSRFTLLSLINLDTVSDWLAVGATPVPAPSPTFGTIPPGRSALVFLQLVSDLEVKVPKAIHHKIRIVPSSKNQPESLGYEVSILSPKMLVLASPFASGKWFPFNAPSDFSRHRRSVLRLFDGFYIAQRYAIDWMRIEDNGFIVKPGASSKENASYVSYGDPIFAVADGTIEKITDDIPENIPDTNTRAVTINLQTIAGNSVILKLSEGRYALYAHLQPKSLRVKEGDMVRKGQIIGHLGNSGNSTAPHLHFHVCDGPSALQCQGVPYVFEGFSHQEVTGEGETLEQLKFTSVGDIIKVNNELIWNNHQIIFK